MSERPTKERILDAAEAIMLEKSFHSVGLNEILKAVGVPKGSFYHHFESKEQFGVELLKHYVADASAYKRRMLLSPEVEPNPLNRLLSYLESAQARFLEQGGKCPCLVLKLAAEVSEFSEPMREVLAEGQREWVGIFETVIREGIDAGAIGDQEDPVSTARLIGNLWMGAMQAAIVSRRADGLREAIQFVSDFLSPKP